MAAPTESEVSKLASSGMIMVPVYPHPPNYYQQMGAVSPSMVSPQMMSFQQQQPAQAPIYAPLHQQPAQAPIYAPLHQQQSAPAPVIYQQAPPTAPMAPTQQSAEVDKKQTEPAEAVVAKPLSILSLFCCLQLWFSIPAMVLAYRKNRPVSTYKSSIALSVTAIIVGMMVVAVFVALGQIGMSPFSLMMNGGGMRQSSGYDGSDSYPYPPGYSTWSNSWSPSSSSGSWGGWGAGGGSSSWGTGGGSSSWGTGGGSSSWSTGGGSSSWGAGSQTTLRIPISWAGWSPAWSGFPPSRNSAPSPIFSSWSSIHLPALIGLALSSSIYLFANRF